MWSGVFQCKEVRYWTLPLYVVFCCRISDLVKSLSAHFVPGISFLYSACNLLLLFCHNPFRVMKPPLLLYSIFCSLSHAHKPQPYKKKGEWVHCRFVFSALHWEMREVKNSTDGEKQKLPCCCCFTTTHSLTFFLSFFFFFFFMLWQCAFHFPSATVTSLALLCKSKKKSLEFILPQKCQILCDSSCKKNKKKNTYFVLVKITSIRIHGCKAKIGFFCLFSEHLEQFFSCYETLQVMGKGEKSYQFAPIHLVLNLAIV